MKIASLDESPAIPQGIIERNTMQREEAEKHIAEMVEVYKHHCPATNAKIVWDATCNCAENRKNGDDAASVVYELQIEAAFRVEENNSGLGLFMEMITDLAYADGKRRGMYEAKEGVKA